MGYYDARQLGNDSVNGFIFLIQLVCICFWVILVVIFVILRFFGRFLTGYYTKSASEARKYYENSRHGS